MALTATESALQFNNLCCAWEWSELILAFLNRSTPWIVHCVDMVLPLSAFCLMTRERNNFFNKPLYHITSLAFCIVLIYTFMLLNNCNEYIVILPKKSELSFRIILYIAHLSSFGILNIWIFLRKHLISAVKNKQTRWCDVGYLLRTDIFRIKCG